MGDRSDVNEFSTLLLDVAMKRKHLPAACSKMLSNTLKIEINNLKYPTVEVDSCVYNSDTWCISEKLKEDIAKSVHNINMLDPFSKVEGILQESRSVIRVLDQIQKEKTCEMDIRLRTLKQHL